MLNGVFGEGETQHIPHWQSIKLVDKSEEEEDGDSHSRKRAVFE
jgi:hypothetical protein